MEYVTTKAYDGSLVRVPKSKLEIYLKTQEQIKEQIASGKTISEILASEVFNDKRTNN